MPTAGMNQIAKAKIRWLSFEEGGRKTPYRGLRYAGVSEFDENPYRGETLWSLIVEFDDPQPVGTEVMARVEFLMPNAPVQVFHSGSRFRLLEGARVVGVGEII